MKTFIKKIKFHYYVITLILAVILYSRSGFYSLSILDHMYSGYGVDGHLIILIVSFVFAFILGYKNSYMSWLYPIFIALIVHLILPFIALIVNFQNRYVHGFLYYIPIGFLFIFLPHIVMPYLGLRLGRQFLKRCGQSDADDQ